MLFLGRPDRGAFLLCESCADYTGSDRGRIKRASNAQKRVSCLRVEACERLPERAGLRSRKEVL